MLRAPRLLECIVGLSGIVELWVCGTVGMRMRISSSVRPQCADSGFLLLSLPTARILARIWSQYSRVTIGTEPHRDRPPSQQLSGKTMAAMALAILGMRAQFSILGQLAHGLERRARNRNPRHTVPVPFPGHPAVVPAVRQGFPWLSGYPACWDSICHFLLTSAL